jgi:uncharacterized protein YqhQ
MSDRMSWKLQRIQKKIKIRQLQDYLKCTHALISMYENEKCEMSPEKVRKYKQYIEEHKNE